MLCRQNISERPAFALIYILTLCNLLDDFIVTNEVLVAVDGVLVSAT